MRIMVCVPEEKSNLFNTLYVQKAKNNIFIFYKCCDYYKLMKGRFMHIYSVNNSVKSSNGKQSFGAIRIPIAEGSQKSMKDVNIILSKMDSLYKPNVHNFGDYLVIIFGKKTDEHNSLLALSRHKVDFAHSDVIEKYKDPLVLRLWAESGSIPTPRELAEARYQLYKESLRS